MATDSQTRPLVLFTGFTPFLANRHNPSWTVAQAAAAAFGEGARAIELDVTFDGVAAFARTAPASALVVGVGLSGREGVQVETVGRNQAGADPDNDGRIVDGPIAPDAIPCLRSDVADGPFFDALRDTSPLPVSRSVDAGGYVCNAYLYHLLTAYGQGGPAAAFVHVPALDPESAAGVGKAIAAGARAWLDARVA